MTTIRPSSTTSLAQSSSLDPGAAPARQDAFAQSELGKSTQEAHRDVDAYERSIPGRIFGNPVVGGALTAAVLCVPGAAFGAGAVALLGGSAAAGAAAGGGLSLFALMTSGGNRSGE